MTERTTIDDVLAAAARTRLRRLSATADPETRVVPMCSERYQSSLSVST